MSLSSWLRNWKSVCTLDSARDSRLPSRHNRNNAARQAKLRFRPRLEALEHRWAPAVFNNADQWTPNVNPNAVWSYGYFAPSSTPETPDATTFTLYTNSVQVQGRNGVIDNWETPNGLPADDHNPLDKAVNIDTETFQPHQAGFHPGPNGEYSVYRFTAPDAGSFALSAMFTSIDHVGGADKDIHVLVNGSELYDDILPNSFGKTKTFSSTLTLAQGDLVDFVVGFGTGPYFFDTTALDATLETADQQSLTSNATTALSVTDMPLIDASRALAADSAFSSTIAPVDAHADVTTVHTGTVPLARSFKSPPAVNPETPALNAPANGVTAATAMGAAAADAVFGSLSSSFVSEPFAAVGPTWLQ